MSVDHLLVKYHSRRMLLTVDLQALFTTLFDAYGDGASIRLALMDEREKAASTEEVDGLQLVRERFRILEVRPGGTRRRTDLEQAAVASGQK